MYIGLVVMVVLEGLGRGRIIVEFEKVLINQRIKAK